MRNRNHALHLGVAVLWGVLVSGCSAGTASLGPADCRPGDSTLTCCIKKHPHDPVGACGASASDLELALRSMETADEVAPMAMEGEDEFANNKDLPDWKQRCIKAYYSCQQDGWIGKCDDCLRYCEGQHEWPIRKCRPRKK